jgi:hypothetical protein
MTYLATLDDLVVRVKQMMNKADQTAADDTGKPSNAQIIAALNESRFEIHGDVGERLPDRFTASAIMTSPANAENALLPASVKNAQVLHVYTRDSGATIGSFQTTLTPIRVREFSNVGESGTPAFYAITGTDMRLRPVPTVDTAVTVYHLPSLTPLTTGTNTFPEIGARWAHIYCLGAAIKLRQINEDGAGGLLDAFDKLFERYVASIERRVPDNHAQLVEQNNASQWQG